MTSLSNDFRGVLSRRIEQAQSHEIMAIAAALTALEDSPRLTRIQPRQSAAVVVPRFEILKGVDEMDQVRDSTSGLIWSRENVGGGRLEWAAAEAACSKLRLGGAKDWRLPTIRELLTLVDYERHDPAIDTEVFSNCAASWYWTSTAVASSSVCAWVVYFDDGFADWGSRNYDGFVRAVRVGQF